MKAIERFIFVSFRIGGFQANYQNSVYYRRSREVLSGSVSLASVAEEIISTVNTNESSAKIGFLSKISRLYDNGQGFYGWNSLRYFLYEYEYDIGEMNRLHKLNWSIFTTAEKDKVTIEHILPQTPSKQYWKDTFAEYSDETIKFLSGSLGNLLPLDKSINSSLQNDSFEDKKYPKTAGQRGYTHGSHSEIEVAQYEDWTAEAILDRGKKLLTFMEKRWGITFSCEQKDELLLNRLLIVN